MERITLLDRLLSWLRGMAASGMRGPAPTPAGGDGPAPRQVAARPPWVRGRGDALFTLRHLLIAAGVAAFVVGFAWARCGVRGCPNVARLASYQPGGASVLLDRFGEPFADLAPVDRDVVALEDLPEHVGAAFVAVEDKRFYEHAGIDYRRVFGALLADIRAAGFVQGFSTITMQLAGNVFPDRVPRSQRTLWRKFLEVRVAREIEMNFTKDEILELYLNHIYFGGGAYGIEAAARQYFDRPAAELHPSQAALLAALVKGPGVYDPRRHPRRARERRDLVLALMAEQGRLDPDVAEAEADRGLGVVRDPPRDPDDAVVAPYYAQAVRRELEDRFGEEIYTSPLRIHTTLDRRVQRAAEEELRRQLRDIERGAFGRFDGRRFSEGDAATAFTDTANYLQGAAVVMEAGTGDVLALVGGRDFERSRFNRALLARRQPGSAFKPFVYAAALNEGYVPSQRIADAPLRLVLEGGEVWEPRNFTGNYQGAISLREALVHSKNVATVRLALAVGLDDAARVGRAAGLSGPIPRLPSMALGSMAASPLEMAAAYTTFANLGEAVEPRFVTLVVGQDEEVVWRREPQRRRVLDPAVAYVVTDMLRDAVRRGSGTAVRRTGYRGEVAGKTGTTNEAADVWFLGYTPNLVGAVWMGFDRPRAIVERASGGRLAAPVWGRMMRRVYATEEWDLPERGWAPPSDVVERDVDPATGLLLATGCRPASGRPDSELFIEGTEPASVCPEGVPEAEPEGLLERFVGLLERAWQGAGDWLARHFGRERSAPPPDRGDRYLGSPRLPRPEEIPAPEIDVEPYEPPELEIEIPDPGPIEPETAGVVTPRGDTLRLPVQRDTGGPPAPPGDSIMILEPTDSGPVLRPAVRPRRDTARPPGG